LAMSAKKTSAINSVTPLMLIRSSTWLFSGSPASRISVANRSLASTTFHYTCRVSSRQMRPAAEMFIPSSPVTTCTHSALGNHPGADGHHSNLSLRIKDGSLYGRGAIDMRAGTAAGFSALRCLRDLRVELKGDVYAESVADEDVESVLSLIRIMEMTAIDFCG